MVLKFIGTLSRQLFGRKVLDGCEAAEAFPPKSNRENAE